MRLLIKSALLFSLLILSGNSAWAEDLNDSEQKCSAIPVPEEEIISDNKVSLPDSLLDKINEALKNIEQEQTEFKIEYNSAVKLSKKAAKKIKKRIRKEFLINKKKIKVQAKEDVPEDYFLEITLCLLEETKPPEKVAEPLAEAAVPPGEGVEPPEEVAATPEEAAVSPEEIAELSGESIGPEESPQIISGIGFSLGYIKNRDYLSSFAPQLNIGLRLPRLVPQEMFFGLEIGYYGGSDSGRKSFLNSTEVYNEEHSLKVIPIILSAYWEIKQLVVKLPHVGLLTPFAGAGLGPYISKFDYDYPDYPVKSGGGWDGSFGLQIAAGAFTRYKSWEFSLDLKYSYATHNSGNGIEGKIGGFSINVGVDYLYGFSF